MTESTIGYPCSACGSTGGCRGECTVAELRDDLARLRAGEPIDPWADRATEISRVEALLRRLDRQ
jgi:hypothetical protein